MVRLERELLHVLLLGTDAIPLVDRRLAREAIEPLDVAGLTDRSRRSWYPALASDLLRAAPKLGVDENQIAGMLAKCGITVSSGLTFSANNAA